MENRLASPLSWKVYIDGAANQKGSGVELILVSPKKITIEKSLRLGFSTTNNKAEYEALLMGMAMVQKMGEKAVEAFSDSRLVVDQVKGKFGAKDEIMRGYLSQVRHLQSEFESSTYYISLEVKTYILIPLPHWQPPQRKVCLVLYLLRTYASLL